MDKNAYDILLFNYYREAEFRGADLILPLINRMDDPRLQDKLSRHLADETKHAWLWTERVRALVASRSVSTTAIIAICAAKSVCRQSCLTCSL